jgi:5-methylthioadenosine/S-adenosylhomocysteine deaminase
VKLTQRKLLRCHTVATLTDDHGDITGGEVLIEGDEIVAVGVGLQDATAEVLDVQNMVALPGFVDTHRHTWQSALRASFVDSEMSEYFSSMPKIGGLYEPEDVYLGNLLGSVSALSAGTTTLFDWSHIQHSPDHSDAAVAGLSDAGIRGLFGYGWAMGDRSDDDEAVAHHFREARRLAEQSFSSADQLLTMAIAARGPEAAAETTWRGEIDLARELGLRFSVHVGAGARNGSQRAVSQYRDAGRLGSDMTFIHCNYTPDDEVAMIAQAGASVSIGVQCEMNSAGIGDVPVDRLVAHGLRPSLSGDTETMCSGDMFTQMRMLLGYQRSWMGGGHSDPEFEHPPLTTRDVLHCATVEGAKANGLSDKVGSLEPGKKADIILLRLDDLNLAGAVDPVASVVTSGHEGNVDTVLVGGRFVKRGGRLVGVDVAGLLQRVAASQARILERWEGR